MATLPTVADIRHALLPLIGHSIGPGTPGMGVVRRCLTYHPTWGSRLQDIQGARVRLAGPQRALQLQLRTHRQWFVVAWSKGAPPRRARDPEAEQRRRLHTAMRTAVRRQTQGWRNRHRRTGGRMACAVCGDVSFLQVDHADVSFSSVRDAFLAGEPAAPRVFAYRRGNCAAMFRREDAAFCRRWQKYHAAHVSHYQLLCRRCNTSKSNRVGGRLPTPPLPSPTPVPDPTPSLPSPPSSRLPTPPPPSPPLSPLPL